MILKIFYVPTTTHHSVFNCFFSDLDPTTSKIHDMKSKSLKFHEKKILQIGTNMKKHTKRGNGKSFLKKWESHYESFENMYYTHIYSTSLHNFKVQGN